MNDDSLTPRQMRWSSTLRGVVIAVLLGAYGLLVSSGGGGFRSSLLIAAGVQIVLLLARRFVPGYLQPQVVDIIELLADAVTVLLFALGVFGGIASYNLET